MYMYIIYIALYGGIYGIVHFNGIYFVKALATIYFFTFVNLHWTSVLTLSLVHHLSLAPERVYTHCTINVQHEIFGGMHSIVMVKVHWYIHTGS